MSGGVGGLWGSMELLHPLYALYTTRPRGAFETAMMNHGRDAHRVKAGLAMAMAMAMAGSESLGASGAAPPGGHELPPSQRPCPYRELAARNTVCGAHDAFDLIRAARTRRLPPPPDAIILSHLCLSHFLESFIRQPPAIAHSFPPHAYIVLIVAAIIAPRRRFTSACITACLSLSISPPP